MEVIMEVPAFTAYVWLNLILLAMLLGFGWSLGCALWAAIVAAIRTLLSNTRGTA